MIFRVLMAHIATEDGHAFFTESPTDLMNEDSSQPSLSLPERTWRRMGQPMLLTVAVEKPVPLSPLEIRRRRRDGL